MTRFSKEKIYKNMKLQLKPQENEPHQPHNQHPNFLFIYKSQISTSGSESPVNYFISSMHCTLHRDHGNSVLSHAAQAARPRTNGTNTNITDIAI